MEGLDEFLEGFAAGNFFSKAHKLHIVIERAETQVDVIEKASNALRIKERNVGGQGSYFLSELYVWSYQRLSPSLGALLSLSCCSKLLGLELYWTLEDDSEVMDVLASYLRQSLPPHSLYLPLEAVTITNPSDSTQAFGPVGDLLKTPGIAPNLKRIEGTSFGRDELEKLMKIIQTPNALPKLTELDLNCLYLDDICPTLNRRCGQLGTTDIVKGKIGESGGVAQWRPQSSAHFHPPPIRKFAGKRTGLF
jgi:hypothetical protein